MAELELSLPRFRIETSRRLGGPLRALGMPAAFGGRPDFSGIHGKRGRGGDVTIGRAPGHRVVADRPFLFAIRDRETGAILFFGRLAAPTPA